MALKLDRRSFLAGTATAAALLGTRQSAHAHGAFGDVVFEEKFARLEKVGENIWAVVSKPVDENGQFNPQTLCNGGLVAGEDRVVAIDAFYTPAGAAWLSKLANEMLGRPITDVVLTHFHADHSAGAAGYQNGASGPDIIATETTRKLIYERYAAPARAVEGTPFSAPAFKPVLPNRILTNEAETVQFDLGGRTLTLDPKKGHTPSDLAIHVDDEPVIFAGDLVWAGFFHNYVDAIPSHLGNSVRDLLKDPQKTIVTGHGYVAKAGDLSTYQSLLDLVEEKAKASHAAGLTAKEGSANFKVPESLGSWQLFGANYYETAFNAWYKELNA